MPRALGSSTSAELGIEPYPSCITHAHMRAHTHARTCVHACKGEGRFLWHRGIKRKPAARDSIRRRWLLYSGPRRLFFFGVSLCLHPYIVCTCARACVSTVARAIYRVRGSFDAPCSNHVCPARLHTECTQVVPRLGSLIFANFLAIFGEFDGN